MVIPGEGVRPASSADETLVFHTARCYNPDVPGEQAAISVIASPGAGATFHILTADDAPEILAFLREVWPKLYGPTGCPDFTLPYLNWLYGGPEAERHHLVGSRLNGRLVGFKAYLHRDMSWAGKPMNAETATHLTIDPDLPLGTRLTIAAELSKLHVLGEGDETLRRIAPSTFSIAFFEENKALRRSVERGARDFNIVTGSFRQAIPLPRKLADFAAGAPGIETRDCRASDMAALRELLTETAGDQPGWEPSEAVLWHHGALAPNACFRLAERNGEILAFVSAYVLDWIKADVRSRVFVVEMMGWRNLQALALLLSEAVACSREQGCRGVVIENASYMNPEDRDALGIMATPREMVFMLRSKEIDVGSALGLRCDVK